jgi:hypothetical protein
MRARVHVGARGACSVWARGVLVCGVLARAGGGSALARAAHPRVGAPGGVGVARVQARGEGGGHPPGGVEEGERHHRLELGLALEQAEAVVGPHRVDLVHAQRAVPDRHLRHRPVRRLGPPAAAQVVDAEGAVGGPPGPPVAHVLHVGEHVARGPVLPAHDEPVGLAHADGVPGGGLPPLVVGHAHLPVPVAVEPVAVAVEDAAAGAAGVAGDGAEGVRGGEGEGPEVDAGVGVAADRADLAREGRERPCARA